MFGKYSFTCRHVFPEKAPRLESFFVTTLLVSLWSYLIIPIFSPFLSTLATVAMLWNSDFISATYIS